ncbi:hypothetical protein FMM05_16610, partial [Flavobacterium zepuense]
MKKKLLIIALLFIVKGFSQNITVSTNAYTPAQLVNQILVRDACLAEVANITKSTGIDYGYAQGNGIGYFQNTNPNFPIASGVVLSTGNATAAQGPNTGISSATSPLWLGDASLEAALAAQGITMNSRNATVLEFDFKAVTSNFSVDFLFASEEYGTYQCDSKDSFVFLLTNLNTGVTTNVAVVPNTSQPISVATISNALYNSSCGVNSQYFGLFNGGGNALASATNFEGQTVLLNASHDLVVGDQYHIKLVIADDAGQSGVDGAYDSAVFFPEGSFNLGHQVVGEDQTVANGGALCNDNTYTINTGLSETDFNLSWTKDNQPVAGGSTITIAQTGSYELTITNPVTGCTAEQTVLIEAALPIPATQPVDLLACENSGGQYVYDLNINTPIIKQTLDPATIVTYHTTQAAAEANTGGLPGMYTSAGNQTIYARVKNSNNDCYVVVSFQLLTVEPPVAGQPANIIQCATTAGGITSLFNLTQLDASILGAQPANQNTITYFTSMANATNNTSPILNPGNYTSASATIYARIQRNFSVSCFDITSFTITVGPVPVVATPANVFACNFYNLPFLPNGQHYYTGPNGTGTQIPNFSQITTTQTIYIFAQSNVAPYCTNQHTFVVNIATSGATVPPSVTACQSYTLPALPPGRFYYTGPGGTGTQLANGTVITTTQTIYFYIPAVAACTQTTNFTVTIVPNPVIPNPGNMAVCQPYTLPVLTTGNYYTGPGGTGAVIPGGTVIASTQTIYIYATTNTTPACTAENSFTVTVYNIDIPDIANVTNCGPYNLPELPIGGYFTGSGGTGNPIAAGAAIATTQTIYAFSQGGTCTDEEVFTVTINPLPVFDPITDAEACGSYTLPPLPAGAGYFNLPDGQGPIPAGTILDESQPVYVLSPPNQFGCRRQRVFDVIVIGEEADNPGDHSVCGGYTLPELLIGDYYTGPGATGTLIPAGTEITTSQTIYVYAVSTAEPFCVAESNFIVTVTPEPVVPAVSNVRVCDSYTLPALPAGVSYRTGPDGTGTVLAAGSSITTSQTIYVYAQSGGTPNCVAQDSFTVTIISGSIAPVNVTACASGYTLPQLPMGSYRNQPNGGGSVIPSGTVITASQTLYVHATVTSGVNCTNDDSFIITILPPVIADDPADVMSCGSYTLLPNVNGNYYTGPGGTGTLLPAGTVLTASQTVYTFNFNPQYPNCRAQHSFQVTVTGPTVTDMPDQTACGGYILPALTVGNYYTQSGGQGTLLPVGSNVTASQTIYIYAQTGTTFICSDEESFNLTILPLPQIPNPGVIAVCGSYILPDLTVGAYYTGPGGSGTQLVEGQAISSTQNIYIYAESGGTPNCVAEHMFQVIVNPQAPPDVSACDSYTLPPLLFGNYFTGPAGTGTPKFAGNVITATQDLYVYVASSTTPNCTDNNVFTITINQTPVLPAFDAIVERCDSYTLPPLAIGNYYTGAGGTGSVIDAGTVLTTNQTVYVYAQTGTSPNCTDEASFDVIIHVTPIADARSAVEICDSYTLTPLITGNYFALPGGPNVPGQIAYSADDLITESMLMYIYAESATSSECFTQNSFQIDVLSIDADNPGPQEACDSYTLPALTVGNYYTLSGGPDVPGQVMMNAGDVITQSTTLYVYAELGGRLNCNDEHLMPITIFVTPVVDDTQGDLAVCFTYTLPALTVGNYYTQTNGGGTQLAAGTQITQSQNIYIYAATGSPTTTCSDQHVYHVTVNSIDVPEIDDFYACITYTLPQLAVGNYFTQPGGQGTLLPPGTVITNTQTIYIFGETNTVPNCTDESDFVITIVQPPLATFPQPLTTCAFDDLGHGTFNLNPALAEALNGQPNVAVSIYETEEDSQFGTNAITDLDSYNNVVAFNQTLYIRLESTLAPGCITLVTVELIAHPRPIAIEPSAPYALCDDGSSDTDGVSIFNLTTYQDEVLGSMSAADYA